MGVSEHNGDTLLRVWAPNAHRVEVAGLFNNWKPGPSERFSKEETSGIWSLTLKGRRPKGAYHLLLNGSLRRRDPYAREATLDGKNSVFHDPTAFDWKNDKAPTPSLDDLVIYELHVGAFNDPNPGDRMPGTFADAAKRLDYLADLGINCVELLPVHAFFGEWSWGYNPSDPFTVEQAYGGPDGLRAFVLACHQRGIAVHLDIVHNHYGPENLDLLQFDGTGNADRGGIYFYDDPAKDMTPWGPRVRFEQPMVRRYVRDNTMMWLEEYRVDGFRWDSTVNIRACQDGQMGLPEGEAMLDEINREIRERFPQCYSIAEDSLGIGNFHASWDYDFHHTVVPVLRAREDKDRAPRLLAAALERSSDMPRVVYVDNHDEAGKINGEQRLASDVDPGDPDSDKARRLCGLGAVLTFTAPGIPLLFMGNEFQERGPFHDDRPLNWSKRARHAGLLALHRALIRLRRNLDGAGAALKGNGVAFPVIDIERKLLVYWRWHSDRPGERMVVAMNLSATPQRLDIPLPGNGPWVLRLDSDASTFGGAGKGADPPFEAGTTRPVAQAALAPYSARIYGLANPAADGAQPVVHAPMADEAPASRVVSMFAALHVAGSFNGWNLTNLPLVRKQGLRWEGVFTVTNEARAAFRISANQDGKGFWGDGANSFVSPPYQGRARRLGPDFQTRAALDGRYRLVFHEDTLDVQLEAIQPPALRLWRDLKGRTVEARCVRVEGTAAVLETKDGRTIKVPLVSLHPDDRAEAESAAR